MSVNSAPVVVGADGSQSSLDAVAWAAREAAARETGLRVVHAFIWPKLGVPLGPAEFGDSTGGLRNEARRILVDAVGRAREAAPDIEIDTAMPETAPVPALLREAGSACMVVLGSRGLGGFSGLLLGSTAVQVAAHAPVPVVVVREGDPDARTVARGDVVVGVDGSRNSVDAIAFAFAEAQRLGTGVLAITVSPARIADPVATGVLLADDEDPVPALALAESMAGWAEKHPDVPVRRAVTHGHPARALTDIAAGATLLVVGSRGAGGFRGLLMGSVSQGVLHHATCPVAIVRAQS
ncbi:MULTISPECIES: universal stress protein [Actinokineospora]|uniref:Universal stress protein n=1 Tax=Actinokineospora fastidiosa TaxID=1816 RepID=A0A918GQR0_9PSEU|nr:MULTISPECIES: universal stress protein [Actinokineospora]UVS78504.1 Universal stress protein [Actinokineospora sp. UTMC 2448]GGS55244.1 universal stress protein [Actinokineospora fastidiosa]